MKHSLNSLTVITILLFFSTISYSQSNQRINNTGSKKSAFENCNSFRSVNSRVSQAIGTPTPPVITASDIEVDQNLENIVSLSVKLNIKHSFANKLLIQLVHPSGTEITLWENNCESQIAINQSLIFNDTSTLSPNECSEETSATSYAPIDKLSGLNGLKANGTWTLRIANTSGETIKFSNWEINLCTEDKDTPTLSIHNFNNLKGTQIYPNPNKGVFTADFGKNKTDLYQITLYDFLGRKVFNRNYADAKNLINLQNISKGNYILVLETNEKKAVSKMIIE